MPRSTILAAGALIAALTAGCAAAPMKSPTPSGLVYDCDPGGQAVITFHGGGYLPESMALGKDATLAPRSTADLAYGGTTRRLVAEWTGRGLRYRSEEADGGLLWIWTARGETALLGRRPADQEALEDESAAGEPVATCRRSGRDPAAPAPQRSGVDHHRR